MHTLIDVKNNIPTGLFTAKKYPDLLRLVVYEDFAQNVVYRFLT